MGRPVQPRDAVLPAALLLLSVIELSGLDLLGTAALPLIGTSAALLVLRRRWPWAACTATCVAIAIVPFFGPELDDPATPIVIAGVATYTMGRQLPDLRGLASVVLFVLLLLGDYGFTTSVSDAVFLTAITTPPYVAGLGVRRLAAHNDRLRAEAAELLALQEQVRREAAAAERGRIARELHDVIAHSVSAMVVQAAAAEQVMNSDPARAATAVREVATTGRRALAETGRLLHLLRDSEDELGLAPDVGLDRLPELFDDFRRRGLHLAVTVEGSVDGLPAGVDLSAYRVAQEALTNAARYGDGAVDVRVIRAADGLRIEVGNRVPEVPRRAAGTGLGLVGMAERVSVFGGTLQHGPTDDGRWLLVADLPVATR